MMQARSTPREPLLKRIARPESPPPWGFGTVALLIVSAFLLMIAGTFVALSWLPPTVNARLLGWILGGGALIGLLYTRIRQRPEFGPALRMGPGSAPAPFLLFLAVGVALSLDLLGLAITGAFLPPPALIGAEAAPSLLTWLLALALMIVVRPASEELVFRGFAQPWLRATLGPWPGLLVSAILSAVFQLLIYAPDYGVSYPAVNAITPLWYGLGLPLLMGLFVAAVRATTGSTRSAIIAHAGFGLFAVLKLLALAG